MLDLLRRKAQSPYLQATVVIIILVFVFWGVGVNQGTGPNVVAKINDDIVSYEEYQRAYDRLYNQLREQFGGNVPDGLVKSLNIKNQVVEQLIQQTLLRQGAADMGIRVSEEELRQKIQQMEAFRNNNTFDINLYREILTSSRISPADFEAGVKEELLSAKVLDLFSRFVRVGSSEIEDRLVFDHERFQFEYVVLKADSFREKVTVKDQELEAFFNDRKDNYKTEPQYKLKYILFPSADISSGELSEEQINEFYQNNITRYMMPEQRRARHILIRTGSGDSKDQIEKKKKQAEEILAKVKKGEDFAQLAKKYSEDGTAKNGGDLGYFSRGQMVLPFEEAAFSLKEGEVSDIVKTEFGFHLIKLDGIRAATTKKVDEVRKQIEAALIKEQGKSIALQKANEAYEKIILAGSIDKYGATEGATVQETGFIEKKSPPQELASDPALLASAFSLSKGELSSLVQTAKGYAIIYVEDVKDPQVPGFTEVKKAVQEDYITEQAKVMAKEAAEQLLADLRTGVQFVEEAKKRGVSLHVTDFISRGTSYTSQLPASVVENAFLLSAVRPLPEEVGVSAEAFYVYRFKDKKIPEPGVFKEKEEEYNSQLLQESRMALLGAWIDQLRHKAEITINDQYL